MAVCKFIDPINRLCDEGLSIINGHKSMDKNQHKTFCNEMDKISDLNIKDKNVWYTFCFDHSHDTHDTQLVQPLMACLQSHYHHPH